VNWPVVSLLDALASADLFVDGDWVESKDQDPGGDVRLVQLADVGDGEYIDKSDRFLTSARARTLRCKLLEPGDVLVARMPDPLGRACIFPGDSKPSVTVVDVCIIRPDARKHDARWLMHCVNAPDCRNQIAGYATGTTRSRISRGNLGKIRMPLPPLPEQRRIAQILDKADALRAKHRTALAELATLTQSIFLDMFGDPATNPKGWPQVSLGDHASKIGSGATPLGGEEAYKTAGITLIRSMNVRDGAFLRDGLAFIDDEQAARLEGVIVEADDVLLNITGASVARVCRAPADVLPARVNQHVAIIRPTSTFNPCFLEQCLLSPAVKERLLKIARAGATREAITKSAIEQFRVIRPPRETQERFAARLDASERTYLQMSSALAETDSLFGSLQHRAFRGEL
jgi:type I restriction enzyme S subunit